MILYLSRNESIGLLDRAASENSLHIRKLSGNFILFIIMDYGDMKREAVRKYKESDVHLLCGASGKRFEIAELAEAVKQVKSVKPLILTYALNPEYAQLYNSTVIKEPVIIKPVRDMMDFKTNGLVFKGIIQPYIVETSKRLQCNRGCENITPPIYKILFKQDILLPCFCDIINISVDTEGYFHMTLNEIETYCQTKPGAYLDWPFGPEFLVIKVKAPTQEKGRIFAQPFMLHGEPKVTLNCDMMTGELYRSIYPGTVTRGYHCPPIQQPYFNTINLDGTVPDDVLIEMIDHAYSVVISKLPKKYQRELEGIANEA